VAANPAGRPGRGTDPDAERQPIDYSTPEGEMAMHAAIDLILDLREKQVAPLVSKIAIYERTLGLAVIPVLVRRAFRHWRTHHGRPGRSAG
jgi:hypothetical protein